MEKQPSYVLMPSLQQMALRKMAVALCSEPRILASFAKLKLKRDGYRRNIWEATDQNDGDISNGDWRKTVEDNLLNLQLPKFAYEQMIPILKAIAIELLTWKSIHEMYLGIPIISRPGCLQKLCWTTVGTLDHRKTAEEIVRCNVVNIVERFELACIYCLEDYIPVLWKELPVKMKETVCEARVETPHLQLFLPYIFRRYKAIGHDAVMTASNSFEEAAFRGNRTLAEYCFRNLSKKEREVSLVRAVKYLLTCRYNYFGFACDFRREKLSDVTCYLLSRMSPEGQLEIFKEFPCRILSCFLDWPWQDLFLDIAKIIWTLLPESQYYGLDFVVYQSIRHSGYYFPSFFQNMFLHSPIEYRRMIVEEEVKWGPYFRVFFENEDMETIRVILRSVDAGDRLRLVSSESSLRLTVQWTHKWHLVEQFLRAAKLSEEGKKRLKESFIEFEKNHEPKVSYDLLREKYRKFFEFLETDASAGNKRSLEDETFTKTKKLCRDEEGNSAE